MLAGQRQWIATTNFAGCPGRPPDSFANSAVLTTSAKVPDALGWRIDPCFPVQIDPKAEQFEQVVACADQRPFAVHLLQSPQQELPESPAALYARVSSDRQDVDLSVAAQLRALRDYAEKNGYHVRNEAS